MVSLTISLYNKIIGNSHIFLKARGWGKFKLLKAI